MKTLSVLSKIIIVLFVISVSIQIATIISEENNIPIAKAVSLPEEIYECKKGDRLIVIKVSDSIYLGFDHLKQ